VRFDRKSKKLDCRASHGGTNRCSERTISSRPQGCDGGMIEQIDFLMLDAPPQTLDEHVVHPASAVVHTNFYADL
jgi:hypothetical protein